jgi:hypothetical protein
MKNLKQIQVFTKDECDYMLSLGSEWKPHSRYKQKGLSVLESYVVPSKNLKLKKLLLDKLCNDFYLKDILYDEIKFIKYTKGVSFGYHIDSFTMKKNLKQYPHGAYKTIIIMMNDGTNYKGGDLILYNDETITAKKTVGNVLCYDSDIPHEVTEVTYGTRISCLILLSTKDFKLSIL